MPQGKSIPDQTVSDLKERVSRLERYWYVTLALAAILGLSGGFLGYFLSDVKGEVTKLKSDVVEASNTLKKETDTALASIKSAVKDHLDTSGRQTVNGWLAEEKQLREAADKNIARWVKFIYQSALDNGDTNKGANGWWQDALKKEKSLVDRELPQ